MQYYRPAAQRGHVNLGWLESYHSFSFGQYHDPKHMGVSALRVINTDTFSPGAGFETHGHRDMEIISCVLEGALEHKDSMGRRHILPAGEIQVMSAGSGVQHSEFNASIEHPVHFLQIWIQPNVRGIAPTYQQAVIDQQGALTLLVSPDGRNNSLTIHQDAFVSRIRLAAGEQVVLPLPAARTGYLHVVRGSLRIGEQTLAAGDGYSPNGAALAPGKAGSGGVEALWFDLP